MLSTIYDPYELLGMRDNLPVISLDTETTGNSFRTGCRPFYISTCTPDGVSRCWEWVVDPKTRMPKIPGSDLKDLKQYVHNKRVVMHNAKFDIEALKSIGVHIPWKYIDDTLIASHIFNSNIPHGLKPLCNGLLNLPEDDERDLRVACNRARHAGRRLKYRIAEPGDPMMPGWKPGKDDSKWKLDMWLPRAIYVHNRQHAMSDWNTVLSTYATRDAERTILLWAELWKYVKDANQVDNYLMRLENLEHTYRMEQQGVTIHKQRLSDTRKSVNQEIERLEHQCYGMAEHTIDNLNSRPQLSGLLFGTWKLPPTPLTDKGAYSTKSEHLKVIEQGLPSRSLKRGFLARYRKRSQRVTGLRYLNSYDAYGMPTHDDYITIHPHILLTGTKTTRYSSQKPNGQNVSKQEDFNLRKVFGPAPGRVWVSIDYANIELRILAYASEETELIKAFASGESVHMNFAWIVCPEAIEAAGGPEKFKKTNQYRKVKNGDFALTYGASSKTADLTYGIPGAYKKIRGYFKNLRDFMDERVAAARRDGYVNTLGDYTLYTPKGKEYTTAVDYYCQGSAGYIMCNAVNLCGRFLKPYDDHHMILSIHDELVFDFPDQEHTTISNDMIIDGIVTHMESCGDEFDIPTPVEVGIHTDNWADETPWIKPTLEN